MKTVVMLICAIVVGVLVAVGLYQNPIAFWGAGIAIVVGCIAAWVMKD